MTRTGPFSALANPRLRRLVLAGIPADFADWLDYVAIIFLIAYQWQAGPFALALIAIAWGLPYLIAGPVIGAVVDRMDTRTALVASNLGRGLATYSLILAPNLPVLLALVLVRGIIDSAFTPARQTAIRALAGEDERDGVNGLVFGFNQLSKIVGPAIGGGLLAIMAPNWVFAVNGSFSILAAILLLSVQVPRAEPDTPDQQDPSLRRELAEGIGEIVKNRVVLAAVSFAAVSLFAVFLYDTFIALLIPHFGFDQVLFGLAISAVGAGGVVGALLVGRWRATPLVKMGLSSTLAGLLLIGLIAAQVLGAGMGEAVFLAVFALVGLLGAFVQVPYRTLLQNETSPGKMGRVAAVGESLSVAAMLTAPLIGGILVGQFGILAPFLAGAGLSTLAGLVLLLFIRPRS